MSNVYKRGLNGETSPVHIVECIYQIIIYNKYIVSKEVYLSNLPPRGYTSIKTLTKLSWYVDWELPFSYTCIFNIKGHIACF